MQWFGHIWLDILAWSGTPKGTKRCAHNGFTASGGDPIDSRAFQRAFPPNAAHAMVSTPFAHFEHTLSSTCAVPRTSQVTKRYTGTGLSTYGPYSETLWATLLRLLLSAFCLRSDYVPSTFRFRSVYVSQHASFTPVSNSLRSSHASECLISGLNIYESKSE